MIKKVPRRMRCMYQGCKNVSLVGLGSKNIDYTLCKDHFAQLMEEGIEVAKQENVFKVEIPTVEEIKQETEEVLVDEAMKEYYVCKYCGAKFDKAEYTVGQFAFHVKQCKKKYEEEAKK